MDDEELRSLFAGYGYEPLFVEGQRAGCHASEDGRRRWTPRSTASARSRSARAYGRTARRASALADDRAAQPEGLDRSEGGRWQEGRGISGARIRCRSPNAREQPRASASMLEEWMRSYEPEELFDESGRLLPELRGACAERRAPHGRQSACQWRSAASASSSCPTSRPRASMCRVRAAPRPKRRARWARYLRDVMRLNAETPQFPADGAGRDRLEPA